MLDENDNKLQETVGEEETAKEKQGKEASTEGGDSVNPAATTEDSPGENTTPDEEVKTAKVEDVDNDEKAKSTKGESETPETYRRHHIPMPDYHAMSPENLVGELQRLVRNEQIPAIKRHVENIKREFDLKFQEFMEQKREEFAEKGGNPQDFKYNSVTKRQFNEVYSDYREKRNAYYKNLESSLHENLEKRLALIEELKGLVSVEEDINTTYKNFKSIQEKWRNAGAVPRNKYNDVWRTYHHHVEIFYDFLHLNRELRDLDFKHNLEEKQKLITRAEKLLDEPDIGKAFRELQTLHKIWKEEIGPVAKSEREAIWERFSNATKAMHLRRQEYFKNVEKDYEKNLEAKKEIIAQIREISGQMAKNHKGLQQQIQAVEKLRTQFFKAGKVPHKLSDETWGEFKDAVRAFNRNKNTFYKELKKLQLQNLDKKKALLAKAEELKDSEDWDNTTPEMKQIQREWKEIGHVPRKYSESIWNQFKEACNHYFERLHARRDKENENEVANYEKKSAILDKLKAYELKGDKEKDLEALSKFSEDWNNVGKVPFSKKNVNSKFNNIVAAILKKAGISQHESELLKYGSKISQLESKSDDRAILKEKTFIRRKIGEIKDEIRQLENNLAFFNESSEDNPLVKEVRDKIDSHKESLATWKSKMKHLNILQNTRNKKEDQSSEEE